MVSQSIFHSCFLPRHTSVSKFLGPNIARKLDGICSTYFMTSKHFLGLSPHKGSAMCSLAFNSCYCEETVDKQSNCLWPEVPWCSCDVAVISWSGFHISQKMARKYYELYCIISIKFIFQLLNLSLEIIRFQKSIFKLYRLSKFTIGDEKHARSEYDSLHCPGNCCCKGIVSYNIYHVWHRTEKFCLAISTVIYNID